jgi:hypothetical protein
VIKAKDIIESLSSPESDKEKIQYLLNILDEWAQMKRFPKAYLLFLKRHASESINYSGKGFRFVFRTYDDLVRDRIYPTIDDAISLFGLDQNRLMSSIMNHPRNGLNQMVSWSSSLYGLKNEIKFSQTYLQKKGDGLIFILSSRINGLMLDETVAYTKRQIEKYKRLHSNEDTSVWDATIEDLEFDYEENKEVVAIMDRSVQLIGVVHPRDYESISDKDFIYNNLSKSQKFDGDWAQRYFSLLLTKDKLSYEDLDNLKKILSIEDDPEFLYSSLHQNNLDLFRNLVELGADINVVLNDISLLEWSLWRYDNGQDLDVAEFLLQHGADTEIRRNSLGTTVLMWCCGEVNLRDPTPKVDLLLRYGADIHAVDRDGKSILHYAVSTSSPEFVEKLLKMGLDPNIPDNKGKYPIDVFRDRWSGKIEESPRNSKKLALLLHYGAKV